MALTDVLEQPLDEEVAARMPEWFTVLREAYRKRFNGLLV